MALQAAAPNPHATEEPYLQLILHSLDGILEALNWLDEGWLNKCLDESHLRNTRANLMLARRILVARSIEGFG